MSFNSYLRPRILLAAAAALVAGAAVWLAVANGNAGLYVAVGYFSRR